MSFDHLPLVVGHRGAAGLAPENTLAGFKLAADLGVPAVELDVRFVHGKLLVIHDRSLDRTTSGTGSLEDHDLETLRGFDAGGGQAIPYLEEVFAALPVTVGVNIELKGPGTARPVTEWLADQPVRDVMISSFNLNELRAAHEIGCPVKWAPLFDRWRLHAWQTARELDAWSINLGLRAVSKRRVADATRRGLKVLVYTVNDEATARRLIEWGVAGLFTDVPDKMLAWLSG